MLLAIQDRPLGRTDATFLFLRPRHLYCYLIKLGAASAQNHFLRALVPSPSPQHRFCDHPIDSECHVEVVEANSLHDNISWWCDYAKRRLTRTARRISWRVASWYTAELAADVFGGNCPGWDSR